MVCFAPVCVARAIDTPQYFAVCSSRDIRISGAESQLTRSRFSLFIALPLALSGRAVRNPRKGWYAEKANAKFPLKVIPTLDTNYVTIMSMVSYGEKFIGTRLDVTVRIERPDGTTSEGMYETSGYYEVQTR